MTSARVRRRLRALAHRTEVDVATFVTHKVSSLPLSRQQRHAEQQHSDARSFDSFLDQLDRCKRACECFNVRVTTLIVGDAMATNPKAVELAKQGKVEYEWGTLWPHYHKETMNWGGGFKTKGDVDILFLAGKTGRDPLEDAPCRTPEAE